MKPDAVVGLVSDTSGHYILLGRKGKCSSLLSEQWGIPGGRIERGESEEQALVREMLEETSLCVHVGKRLGQMRVPASGRVIALYACSMKDLSQKPIAGSDLVEVRWVPKHHVATWCLPRSQEYWPRKVLSYLDSY
jgi:8-oxo-dGTP diphosphatase